MIINTITCATVTGIACIFREDAPGRRGRENTSPLAGEALVVVETTQELRDRYHAACFGGGGYSIAVHAPVV